MTLEEAIKAELSKGIHGQLTDIVNRAVRKGYELAEAKLVHCKDCKWNKSDKWVDCHMTEMFGRTTDNYCSLAQRKEE